MRKDRAKMAEPPQEELEARLGRRFGRPELLRQALTHSSYPADLAARKDAASRRRDATEEKNERLEFLGDAVLGLLASEFLLEAFPEWSEGQLSKSRARLVNARSLEAAARRLSLGEYLRLGRGEEKTGGREKTTVLADAFEALVAAIYLDAGLAAARQFLKTTLFEEALADEAGRLAEPDHKSGLQEYLQGRGRPPADYRLAGESGPDHRKTFRVEVVIEGQCVAMGEGSNKKDAEQAAARLALEKLAGGAAR